MNQELKDRTSKLFKNLEESTHSLIDNASNITDKLKKEVSEIYSNTSKEFNDLIKNLSSKDIKSLQDGDLVVSPYDITLDGNQITKNTVFEFKEAMADKIMVPLYEPSAEQVLNYGVHKTLREIVELLLPYTKDNKELDQKMRDYILSKSK